MNTKFMILKSDGVAFENAKKLLYRMALLYPLNDFIKAAKEDGLTAELETRKEAREFQVEAFKHAVLVDDFVSEIVLKQMALRKNTRWLVKNYLLKTKYNVNP